MKLHSLWTLALATTGSVVSANPARDPPAWPNANKAFDILEKVAPNIKPVQVLDSTPRLRPDATRKQIRFGPYELAASKVLIQQSNISFLPYIC
jgi:hypothetical protein